MNLKGVESKKGNPKSLTEAFITNFKIKTKERIKKNNHKLFFLNFDEKQF